MTSYAYTEPAKPTEVGQRVRFRGYGGRVALWMAGGTGTVVRFTARGNPVIAIDDTSHGDDIVVPDTYGVAGLIDEDGTWIWQEKILPS